MPLKINLYSKVDVMEKIKSNLGGRLLEGFRKTCFGHFLNFSITKPSSQLLLHLIQKQCKPKKSSEINFNIGGNVIKFGLRDFALITGLNCGILPHINKDSIKGGGRFRNIYFEGDKVVTRKYLNLAFKVNKNAPDEDMLKMSLLYCLESFLLPRQDTVNVEMDHILMIDDDELFNNYPWGKVAFDMLVDYMRKATTSKCSVGIGMGGFIYALLVWAYEVIPTLSTPPNKYARRIGSGTPRIVNWAAELQPEWKDLEAQVFRSPKVCSLFMLRYKGNFE